MEACLLRVFEKKSGVAGQASDNRRLYQEQGVAAYPYEHSHSTPSSIFTHFPVQRLGPSAEFEHLAQYSDFPLRRDIPQHIQHSANSVRIRVVAIVNNSDTIARDSLAAHFARRQLAHSLSGFCCGDSEYSSYRDTREDIANCVPPQARFRILRRLLKADAIRSERYIGRANVGSFRKAIVEIPGALEPRTRSSSKFSTAVPSRFNDSTVLA